MKSILLTSTALVAFAGAAAADGHASVSHTLSGKFGYTENENYGSADAPQTDDGEAIDYGEDGFFWEGNLKTTATAELNNGITAGAYFEVTVAEDDGDNQNDGGKDFVGSDFVLSLESGSAGLFFGDTGTAADKHWTSAGDMEQDNFTPDGDGGTAVLRGDVMIAGIDASVSYLVDDANAEAEQLSFGAKGTFGAFTVGAAYQEEVTSGFVAKGGDYNANEILGAFGSGTFAGATVTVAYAEQNDASSTGIQIGYPVGPVTLTAYYVDESDADANLGVTAQYKDGPIDVTAKYRDEQGRTEWNLEGSYDVGNGLKVLAGVLNEDENDADFYLGADYDLGGGATATFAYAMDENGDQKDEIGAPEYDPGFTAMVSFSF